MPGFLSPGKGMPLLLIPEYSGINKGQRFPDRSKTAHRKPPVKCFLTKKQHLEPDMEQQTSFQTGKVVLQGYILSFCLFNFYAEYIMRNEAVYYHPPYFTYMQSI